MGLSVPSPRGSATQSIGVAVSSCPQPRYPVPCGLRPCGLSTSIPSSPPFGADNLKDAKHRGSGLIRPQEAEEHANAPNNIV